MLITRIMNACEVALSLKTSLELELSHFFGKN